MSSNKIEGPYPCNYCSFRIKQALDKCPFTLKEYHYSTEYDSIHLEAKCVSKTKQLAQKWSLPSGELIGTKIESLVRYGSTL